jgi:hypothetical protein
MRGGLLQEEEVPGLDMIVGEQEVVVFATGGFSLQGLRLGRSLNACSVPCKYISLKFNEDNKTMRSEY